MPSTDEGHEELPKVERIVSSQPISHPQTLQMLSQFLMDEQERRQSLRESHNLGTTWKDLQNAYETVSAFQDPGIAEGGYDTFDGNTNNNNNNNTSMLDTGTFGEVQKFALSAAQSIMGSPAELTPAQKEKKMRKERKRKRKEKEKEAKRQAKLQAKMMMGQENRRF